MNNEHNSIINGTNKVRDEPFESLDAVVLHDTLVAGRRGLSVLARLTGILEDDLVEIRPRTWRIDLLQDPSAAEYATQDVSTAHLIVVSTSGQHLFRSRLRAGSPRFSNRSKERERTLRLSHCSVWTN